MREPNLDTKTEKQQDYCPFVELLQEFHGTGALTSAALCSFEKNDRTERLNDSIELVVYRQSVIPFLLWLKSSTPLGYTNALDIAVTDAPSGEFRFTVRYVVQSLGNNNSLAITTKTNETLVLETSQSIYPAFNWAEREAWDLFGIMFSGHPDLRRILTDYGFVGHPMRKDYPLSGFTEISYSDESKRIEQARIEMSQRSKPAVTAGTWVKR